MQDVAPLFKDKYNYAVSHIKQFFYPLETINNLVRKTTLGEFWPSLWKKYGHRVLDQEQLKWIATMDISCKQDSIECHLESLVFTVGIEINCSNEFCTLKYHG